MTLEELLRTTYPIGPGCMAPEGTLASPNFRVSIMGSTPGGVHMLIHAEGHDSATLDFFVTGNTLVPIEHSI